MRPNDKSFNRLPQWAQMEIERLERDIEYYKDKLAEGPKESDTFARRGMVEQPLGTGTDAYFKFEDKVAPNGHKYSRGMVCRVRTNHKGRKFLDVYGDNVLSIEPKASNTCEIYLREEGG